MSVTEVKDLRAAEIPVQPSAEKDTIWKAVAFRPETNQVIKVSGPGIFGGMMVLGGAGAVGIRIFDSTNPENYPNATRVDELRGFARPTGVGAVDRDLLGPRHMEKGILLVADATGATVIVLFR